MEQLSTQKTRNFLTETDKLNTILDFIRWGASSFTANDLFFGHGTNNAIDEAAALVFYAIHLDHNVPDCYLHASLTAYERKTILELFSRRIEERKPAAYLTNEAFFCGLRFYVDERTLIPRSPIAELIENAFSPWCDADSVNRILDLGTGSGCIAIACGYRFPNAQVVAVDTSKEALAVASINVEKHAMENQVELKHSDLFADIDSQQYDLIISNPPYVSDSEWRSLPDEYRTEPKLGFHGGQSGLDIVHQILAQAQNYLTDKGILVVEVGRSAETLQQTYPDVDFLWIDFEHGGDGVFLLTSEQLTEYQQLFDTNQHRMPHT